jgi:hypothetical protein
VVVVDFDSFNHPVNELTGRYLTCRGKGSGHLFPPYWTSLFPVVYHEV